MTMSNKNRWNDRARNNALRNPRQLVLLLLYFYPTLSIQSHPHEIMMRYYKATSPLRPLNPFPNPTIRLLLPRPQSTLRYRRNYDR